MLQWRPTLLTRTAVVVMIHYKLLWFLRWSYFLALNIDMKIFTAEKCQHNWPLSSCCRTGEKFKSVLSTGRTSPLLGRFLWGVKSFHQMLIKMVRKTLFSLYTGTSPKCGPWFKCKACPENIKMLNLFHTCTQMKLYTCCGAVWTKKEMQGEIRGNWAITCMMNKGTQISHGWDIHFAGNRDLFQQTTRGKTRQNRKCSMQLKHSIFNSDQTN